jgi:PncC family amidohydrolase
MHNAIKYLQQGSWTLGTAESCTGGLIAKTLSDYPGSSRYFFGGVVAYANQVKQQLLGVDPALIEQHGAVSKEVAEAMAMGVRKALGVDLGVSTTGIAGPDGGTALKPVGTVWIAQATSQGVISRCLSLKGDRSAIREQSVKEVLDELALWLTAQSNVKEKR